LILWGFPGIASGQHAARSCRVLRRPVAIPVAIFPLQAGAFTWPTGPLNFPAMSPRGSRQKPNLTKVAPRLVSPDDVKSRMQERDRLAATDTRTEAQRWWLGDPPPHRSALAQRNRQ
jgi:hypothetical protein